MSRAFVKETDLADPPPEREISPHTNYVTRSGLQLIEAEIERLSRRLSEARIALDNAAEAQVERDLRYWQQRHATAQVLEAPSDNSSVHFGSAVVLRREDGSIQRWRIVGEDEADPTHGSISYVSPLARTLMNKEPGDEILWGSHRATITSIEGH